MNRDGEPGGGSDASEANSAAPDAPADATARADTDAPDAQADGGHATAAAMAAPTGGLDGRALLDRVWALVRREYRLATRRRWTLGATLVFALFSVGVVAFGAGPGPARGDAVLASLVELGVYVVPLVALAVGYDAVVGAEASGSLPLVRSLPTPAWAVVVGTSLGRAGALGGALLVGFVPGLVVAVWLLGPAVVGPYAVVALAALAAALGFLAVAVLVSTVANAETHALGAALSAWLWFVLLHDLVALGAVAGLDLSGRAVAVAVLANPADCFRVLALHQFDVVAGGFGAAAREAGLSVGLTAAGALAWIGGPVALAGWLVARR